MNQTVTKAIIPAAGLGTRFLPQTKAMPKEMLPIVEKPVIQIVVEELVEVGVTDIIIVTGAQKRAIEDHFDQAVELEQELIARGKGQQAAQLRKISELANFIYVRQKGYPQGNARPVLNASHLIGDEPFFVLFPDDFFKTKPGHSRARQLLDAYRSTQASVISLIEVDQTGADKYAMVQTGEQPEKELYRVEQLVEKPGADNTPSNLASVAGYLLTPDILPIIAQEKPGKGGELVLADSVNELAQTAPVFGKIIDGIYHDTGNKLSYLKAVVDMALENPKFGREFEEYLKSRLC